jgi:hypothetical protein
VGNFARNPDLPTRVRHLEELVRRLGTRKPVQGMPITTVSITDADLFNRAGPFEGWQVNDPVTFVAQGNTVHVWGSVLWTGATAGYPYGRSSILRPGVLPAGFLPDNTRRILMTTGGIESPEKLWSGYLLVTGELAMFPFHNGSPGPPWIELADFATPTVCLEFTYPVVI